MARTEIWGSDCRKADAKGYFEQQMERYRQLTASTVDRMSAIQERLNALYDRIQASGDSNLMQDAETIRSSYQAKTVQPEVACDGTISTSSSRPLSLVPADHVEYLAKQQAAYQHVKNVQPAGTATSNVHSNSGVIRNRFGRDQQRRSSRLASAVDRQTSSARRRYPPLSALAAYWNWHRTLEMGKRIHPGLPAVVRSTIEAMDPGFALDDMLCLPQVTRCDGADRN